MAATSPERPSQAQHRRETLLWIVLPMAGGALLVIAGAVAAMLLRQPAQVSVLADWLSIIFLLCPVLLCLFPLSVLFLTGAIYMNQVHRKTAQLMGRAEAMSHSLADKTINVTENISKKSIGLNAKFAFLDPLWRVFDGKEDTTNGKNNP